MSGKERVVVSQQRALSGPNFEWFLVFCGLIAYLSTFLSGITARWSPHYSTALYLFAALYYLAYRKSPTDGRPGAGIFGWAAVLWLLAFVAGSYVPWLTRTLQRPDGEFQTKLTETLEQRVPGLGQFLFQYGIYSNLAVFTLAFAWYLLFRTRFDAEKAARNEPKEGDPHLERFGLYLGLLTGLGLSIRNGAKGWCNVYWGEEQYWNAQLWKYLGPTFLICIVATAVWILFRSRRQPSAGTRFPYAYGAFWLVLVVQNAIAQLVTGPWSDWNEVAFSIYYLLLFFITAVIAVHYRMLKAVLSQKAVVEAGH
jgi:hypothetical protein